jgi:hypothetical protein
MFDSGRAADEGENPQSSRLKEKAAEQGTPRPLAAKWHFQMKLVNA